ncbi:MAG: hypothetical protein WAW37_21160 [Syntrophobacteraceae bacterium]
MLDDDIKSRYELRTARGSDEAEAVFRFRYEHFFHSFADGYPGLDRARKRLFGPHDTGSTHYCAFDAHGKLCAVSTSTPACAPDVPAAWREWFQFGRLAPPGLEGIVVSTRMVIHPDHRHNGLFDLFYRFIIERYLDAGFSRALHYCSPGFVCRYEHLGHRLYGEPFMMPPGLLRVCMLMALDDPDHLLRVGSPVAGLCAARPPRSGASARALLPELAVPPNFRLFSPEERVAYILARAGADRLAWLEEILPEIEHASPLRLRAGLSHSAPPHGGFLCLVLNGEILESGARRTAGPGSFVGLGQLIDPGSPPSPFTVLTDAEVLVFDQGHIRADGRRLLAGRALANEVIPCGTPL